ncbi:hypothetical protein [Cupriavidus oxalaticus]|uniref:DUF1640 domain-containing protein n=1 Tax=Cupriavidus oxalaticus TaxID=96344 RepID=A0A5P3VPN3_9BURK|nr:hypothetical protein [Cupriavidus oxalaticus]QEZ47211.1 hypothetical protein D2917_23975 [Cupriavidus oxalaticus]
MAKSPEEIRQKFDIFMGHSETIRSEPTPEIDLGPQQPHHEVMTSITREELDAKLDAVRSDGRATAAEMKGQMSDLRADVAAQTNHLEAQFHQLRADITALVGGVGQSVARIEGRIDGVEGKIDGLKSSISMLQFIVGAALAAAAVWVGYQQLRIAQAPPAATQTTAPVPVQPIVIQVPAPVPSGQTQPAQK